MSFSMGLCALMCGSKVLVQNRELSRWRSEHASTTSTVMPLNYMDCSNKKNCVSCVFVTL